MKVVLTGEKILEVGEDPGDQRMHAEKCQRNGLWDLGWQCPRLLVVSSCTAQKNKPTYLTHLDMQPPPCRETKSRSSEHNPGGMGGGECVSVRDMKSVKSSVSLVLEQSPVSRSNMGYHLSCYLQQRSSKMNAVKVFFLHN